MASHREETRAKVMAGAPSQAPSRPMGLDEQERYPQLFPGIPNEISLDLIAAKFLTWKNICIMSSVSRGWCQAVRSRRVYNARVRAQSTEPFTWHSIIAREALSVHEMFLRSMRDCNSCYQLPAISGLRDLPLGSGLVPLDGRIFMMGGRSNNGDLYYSNEVYVLDLAGHKQWKPCAKMKQARGDFGCSVLDGRIYVFGGRQFKKRREAIEPVCESEMYVFGGRQFKETREAMEPVSGTEMYDPNENIWRSVKTSPYLRFLHSAVPIGSELVMEGGDIVYRYSLGRPWVRREVFLEAYHPGKDEWRVPSNRENWVRKLPRLQGLHRLKVETDGTVIISWSPHPSSPVPYLSV